MVRPRLLLIDEISEGLQSSVIAQIASVLRRERDAGTAMLPIELNVAFALAIADRWAVLERGAIDDQGSCDGRREPDRPTIRHVTRFAHDIVWAKQLAYFLV